MWILASMLGFFAISDNGKIVSYRLYDGGMDPDRAAEGIIKLEAGECPAELEELLSGLDEKTIKTDSETILTIIRKKRPDVQVSLINSGDELRAVRSALHDFIVSHFKDYGKYVEYANMVSLRMLRDKLREVGGEPDKMIIQAVTMIEELTEAINAFVAHLREWYGIVFPELGKIVDDHRIFAKIVHELGRPENFTEHGLRQFLKSEKKIRDILQALETSAIVKITSEDEKRLRETAGLILRMYEMRESLERYLRELMEDTCPNITALVGPTIGAKLIRRAGGLRQLALKPASTIQVLGAEKALFRALRGKGTPPKHGIIFVHPLIFRSPWWQRGKIARALATKLAIAARVDYFSKEYIGDELKNELMLRVEEIRKKYPKPPPEKIKKRKPRIKAKKAKKKKK